MFYYMPDFRGSILHKFLVYVVVWSLFVPVIWFAFPLFGKTVFNIGIALTITGAWLYRYVGVLVSALLLILFYGLVLTSLSNESAINAANPFGVSFQLVISGSVALFKSKRDRLSELNLLMEQRIEKRNLELRRVQEYILRNSRASRMLLGKTLLDSVEASLSEMQDDGQVLASRLLENSSPLSQQANRLKELIQMSSDLTHDLRLADYQGDKTQVEFSCAVMELANNFTIATGTQFKIDLDCKHNHALKSMQHQLFGILREAVINAIRHGRAKSIHVQLKLTENVFELTVVNDGLPFLGQNESGLGLKLMSRSAQQIGGSIRLGTIPDGQTCLQCNVPVPPGY
jgi:signal transduction histidine kinase